MKSRETKQIDGMILPTKFQKYTNTNNEIIGRSVSDK